jgi:hypothetical protein
MKSIDVRPAHLTNVPYFIIEAIVSWTSLEMVLFYHS